MYTLQLKKKTTENIVQLRFSKRILELREIKQLFVHDFQINYFAEDNL